jgi:hypothetical protein
MKLAVTVNQPQSGNHFKPMEEVHGRVELRACEKQKMPVCISIFFKGDDTRRSPSVEKQNLGLTCSVLTARQGPSVVDAGDGIRNPRAVSRAKSLQKDVHSLTSLLCHPSHLFIVT